jgi:hypothetical protein
LIIPITKFENKYIKLRYVFLKQALPNTFLTHPLGFRYKVGKDCPIIHVKIHLFPAETFHNKNVHILALPYSDSKKNCMVDAKTDIINMQKEVIGTILNNVNALKK